MATFANSYYKRTAGTPKPCFVCYKPTPTVLATINTVDFFYICPVHLSDPGFASPLKSPDATPKPEVSQEDVGKAIADWEDRQKRKAAKEKEEKEKNQENDKDKGKEGDSNEKDKGKAKGDDLKSPTPALPGSFNPKPATQGPTHEKFVLHRDIFSSDLSQLQTVRTGEHRKRRQTAQAKDLAPRLPGAPRGDL